MNSMKTLFMAAILVAVLYGVYVVVNRNPGSGTLPEAARDVTDLLNVDPGLGSSAPASPAPGAGMAPAFTPGGSSAPRFGGTAPTSEAPSYAAGGAAGQNDRDPSSTAAPPFGVSEPAAVPTTASPAPSGPGALSPYPPPGADASPTGLAPPEMPRALAPPPMGDLETGQPAPARDFPSFIAQVDQELAAGRLAEAHLMLSRRYDDPALAPAERGQVEQMLDQLAGTVVYSREHFLEQPYVVLPTDTLQKIAERCNVPIGLLAKINGLDPKTPLRPGQELKIVRGPFDATISLSRHELTLKLAGGRYAGRFPIGVGPDLARSEGKFTVTDKTDVSALPGEQSQSWGTRWIGLGRDLGIHGTSHPESIGKTTDEGYIRLGNRDVEDLFDILSIGSTVVIRR